MTLQTLSIDKGIINHNIKRYWWVSALSFIVILCATILRILLIDFKYYIERIDRLPSFFGELIENDPGILMLIPTVSVLIAICVLRYLQSPKGATLIHALPPKRTTLFASSFISGIILLSIPIISGAIILSVLSAFTQYSSLFSILHVLKWCGLFLLYSLAFYSFAIFVGIFTGSSTAQFVFTYILLALPLGLLALVTQILDGWLFAFAAETSSPVFEMLMKILPFHYPMAIMRNSNENVDWWQYFVMGGYTVVSYIVATFFYNKRNIENSGDVVAFKFIKPIFLYGAATCVSLVGAVMIKSITGADDASLLALICFGILGYAIAKMLLLKSFRILKFYKGALAFICITTLFWAAINYNIFAFGKTTPDFAQVESAYIGSYLSTEWSKNELKKYYNNPSQNSVFKEEENIKTLINIQKKAIEGDYPKAKSSRPYDSEFLENYSYYYISYRLKNGRMLTRRYTLLKDDFLSLLSTPEAKDYMFHFLRKQSEYINYVDVMIETPDHKGTNSITISSPQEKASLIKALNEDIDNLFYEEFSMHTNETYMHVEFNLNIPGDSENRYAYMQINSKFKNTLEFLKNNYAESFSLFQNAR